LFVKYPLFSFHTLFRLFSNAISCHPKCHQADRVFPLGEVPVYLCMFKYGNTMLLKEVFIILECHILSPKMSSGWSSLPFRRGPGVFMYV